MRRRVGHLERVLLGVLLLVVATAGTARADKAGVKRWKTWAADLDHLYETIEKAAPLKEIFRTKGIDWKKVKKEADKRFKAGAKAARKRKKDDERADEIAFYDVVRYVIAQLRDSHAGVKVDQEIHEAWSEAQPKTFHAGIELLPGTHGLVLVANTFAGRGSNSPLRGRGVLHDMTYLESVNGTPAPKYFDEKARRKREEEGWMSTPGFALVESMNDLEMPEDGKLELVFKTLKADEKARQRYVEMDAKKRAKAFKAFKWKTKKVTLRAAECRETRNPRNFRFMGLPRLELSKTADKDVWYGKLPSGYAYVWYGGVSGTSRQGLDEACEALAECPGLVLDMRLNGGGGETGVWAFHRREGTWKKPVAVLVGPKTFSAGETEVWELRNMRQGKLCNVRIFGQTTAGASGSKIRFKLPSGFAEGRFVYRHWRGGRSKIEGSGIEPDEVVLQDLVELSLGIDSCIRRAEAWLGKQ
jgi:C-terminal processing protease CtpA/Prc